LAVIFAGLGVALVLGFMSSDVDGGRQTVHNWPLMGIALGVFALTLLYAAVVKRQERNR
jgi:hypothetical protein